MRLPDRATQLLQRWRRRDDRLTIPWTAGSSPRVLFVSGQGGVPQRYRVLHQAEQLAIGGIAHACYEDSERRLGRLAAECDLLYLYRARNTRSVQNSIRVARSRGVPVVYDTDDLIWDQRLTEYCALNEHYSAHEVKEFQALFSRTDALMREADLFVASTHFLADALRAWFGRPAFVNQNAISLQAVRLSETIYRQRIDAQPSDTIRIAYFSGWPKAHEDDFAVAVPAITRALAELPNARLRIAGHFDATRLPESLRHQVESAPFVSWDELFASIAQVDINLAPIIDNPHRRAKSAVKFLEAALVGTPTIASDLEPYQTIAHGQTGYLAGDASDWYAGIMALAASSEHRRQVGQAARDYVLRYHTTEARAASFEALLRGIVQRTIPESEGGSPPRE